MHLTFSCFWILLIKAQAAIDEMRREAANVPEMTLDEINEKSVRLEKKGS